MEVEEEVGVGLGVGVEVAAGSVVGVGVEVAAAHVCFVMAVLFNVTAPFLARSLPLTVEPPLSVIVVKASIFPTRVVEVPRVAEEPTCQ